MNFPQKVMAVPEAESPLPDIYKKLKEANADYNPSELVTDKTYLPDFANAIELGEYVYRVNVPGYFYRCPGAVQFASSSGKSGLIIDRYNYRIDTIANHLHYLTNPAKAVKSKITKWDLYATKKVIIDETGYSDMFLEANFQNYIEYKKDNKYTYTGESVPIGFATDVDKNSNFYKPKDFTVFAPKTRVGGVECHVAILANQRWNPVFFPNTEDLFQRDFGLDYFVGTGESGFGGIENSLVPIIPGVKTTDIPYVEYDEKGDLEKGGCCGNTYVEGFTSWESPGICESRRCHFTCIAKIGDNYYGVGTSIETVGLEEAKGTYVYYYHDSTNTDKFYFIPCKTTPSDVKPLTKIRAIGGAESCTYNLPSSNVQLQTNPNSYCIFYKHDSSTKPAGGKQTDKLFESDWGGYECTSDDDRICQPTVHAHTAPFDIYMRDIFANSSIDGHKDKFVAQEIKTSVYPGKSGTNISAVIGHATHKLFDPTTQGV